MSVMTPTEWIVFAGRMSARANRSAMEIDNLNRRDAAVARQRAAFNRILTMWARDVAEFPGQNDDLVERFTALENGFTGRLAGREPSQCDMWGHSWVAGICYVDDEDVWSVAEMRKALGQSAPECERCDTVYTG